jgi:phosphatidylglycerophosphate synthase
MPESTPEFEYVRSLKPGGRDITSPYIKVNRYINRPLASLLVRSLIRSRITPNQVSFFSFLLGLTAAAFFSAGKRTAFVLGGIFIQLCSVVDCADGMLARSRGQSSEYGKYLDIFLDRLVEFFLLTAISIGVFRSTGEVRWLILGLTAGLLYFLHIGLFNVIQRYGGAGGDKSASELRGLFLLLILLFAVINRLEIGLCVLMGASFFINLGLVIHFVKLGKRAGGPRPQATLSHGHGRDPDSHPEQSEHAPGQRE